MRTCLLSSFAMPAAVCTMHTRLAPLRRFPSEQPVFIAENPRERAADVASAVHDASRARTFVVRGRTECGREAAIEANAIIRATYDAAPSARNAPLSRVDHAGTRRARSLEA